MRDATTSWAEHNAATPDARWQGALPRHATDLRASLDRVVLAARQVRCTLHSHGFVIVAATVEDAVALRAWIGPIPVTLPGSAVDTTLAAHLAETLVGAAIVAPHDVDVIRAVAAPFLGQRLKWLHRTGLDPVSFHLFPHRTVEDWRAAAGPDFGVELHNAIYFDGRRAR